jgi:hypothetical protein
VHAGVRETCTFTDAWRPFHDSFAENAAEVGQSLYDSFKLNVTTITPSNLHGTIQVLKGIGQGDRARELLDLYVAQRKEGRDFWVLDQHRSFRNFTDADMIQAFADKHASFAVTQVDPAELLIKLKRGDSWNDRDLIFLAGLSVDDYERIFLQNTGERLRSIVSAALQFSRIGNATPAMQAITNGARAALQRIGARSTLNAMRVQKYGVGVEQEQQGA